MKEKSPINSPESLVSRRGFLEWTIWTTSSIIALAVAAPAATYFLAPAFKKREQSWVDLGDTSLIPVGTAVKVEYITRRRDGWLTVEGRSSAWVLTKDGKAFIAYDPHCTHLGCPYRWNQDTKQFLCPCHNGVFNEEGQVVSGPPPRPLDRLPVKVEDGRLFVEPKSV